MVDVTPQIQAEKNVIQFYDETGFMINGNYFNGAIYLTPDDVQSISITSHSDLKKNNLSALTQGKYVDYCIIGEGHNSIPLPFEPLQLYQEFFGAVECMSTAAACRTYNVLVAEGRKIAAFLIPSNAK